MAKRKQEQKRPKTPQGKFTIIIDGSCPFQTLRATAKDGSKIKGILVAPWADEETLFRFFKKQGLL